MRQVESALHSGPAVRLPKRLTLCSPLLWLLLLLLLLLGWRLFHVAVRGGGDDQVVCRGECHLPPSSLTSPLPHFKQVIHGVRETLATVLVVQQEEVKYTSVIWSKLVSTTHTNESWVQESGNVQHPNRKYVSQTEGRA